MLSCRRALVESLRNISTPVTTVCSISGFMPTMSMVADLDDPALDATRGDGAAAGDREHVDRHQERLMSRSGPDVIVDGLHELEVPDRTASPLRR